MISFTELSGRLAAVNRKNWIWIGLVLGAVAATQSYYLREMLAALILFSVLFLCIYVAAFAIFLFVRACKPLIAWAEPRVGKLVHLGVGAFKDAMASPAWARAVPYRSRRQQLKRNVLNTIACLRSAAVKPTRVYVAQVYMIGLRAGVVAVTIGSSLRRTVFGRLGPWLREPVTLRLLASPPSPGRLFLRVRRMASRHSNVFSRRPRPGRDTGVPGARRFYARGGGAAPRSK